MTDDIPPVTFLPLSLAERKALNWYRVNGPALPNASGAPQTPHRTALVRRGLVQIDPNRKRFDPILYSITERGLEALR